MDFRVIILLEEATKLPIERRKEFKESFKCIACLFLVCFLKYYF